MFYSAKTKGFYDPDIHGDNIPDDAVEVGREYHAELMTAQANGKLIAANDNGEPVAIDPPPPTADELAVQYRSERDRLLAESDWVVIKAAEVGEAVPEDWRAYRQALRNVPAQDGFPQSIVWPSQP